MLLTKKRLHRIKKSKYQSRKKYQKGGKKKRRKRKRKRSFRKRRKALNLRRKSLKKYNQRGGTRDELIMLVPTIHHEHPTKVSALMFIKTKDPIIKRRMISAFIQGRDIEFRRFVFKMLDDGIYDDIKNMGLRGGKYIRLPEGQHLNTDDEKDLEYLVKLNLTLLGIQKKNPQLSSREIESKIAILASQPVVSKKIDNETKEMEPVKSEFPSASMAGIASAKVAAKKLKKKAKRTIECMEENDPVCVKKNKICNTVTNKCVDKPNSTAITDTVVEEYEDDFEDPCEGVKCEPLEKNVLMVIVRLIIQDIHLNQIIQESAEIYLLFPVLKKLQNLLM